MNVKKKSEFESRGGKKEGVRLNLKTAAITITIAFSIIGGALAHDDRYAKKDEVDGIKKEIKRIKQITERNSTDLEVVRTIQLRIEKGQEKIIDKLDEISR
jgi:hypothetical protein